MNAVLADWPMFGLTSDVRPALALAWEAGEPLVLATLGSAEGGAPLGPGAQMLFASLGVTGFLSGGCVEADVALHAAETLQDGQPRTLTYGEGGAPDLPLPCGGRIVVLLERIAPQDAEVRRLLDLDRDRLPALWLSDGRERICVGPHDVTPASYRPLLAEALDCVAMSGDGDRLARRFDPRQRLIVVGHDPIALATTELGLKMGWSTTLVRPFGPETPPPLAGVEYRRGEPGEMLEALRPDPWTAVVIATHDQQYDHAAALAATCSKAGYVGLLGSRRRLPARLSQLKADGAPVGALAQTHAPVGLPLGAATPFEVAVSIVAEIVQVTAASKSQSLWPLAARASAA